MLVVTITRLEFYRPRVSVDDTRQADDISRYIENAYDGNPIYRRTEASHASIMRFSPALPRKSLEYLSLRGYTPRLWKISANSLKDFYASS